MTAVAVGAAYYCESREWGADNVSKPKAREASEPAKPLEAYEAHLLMAAGDVSRVRAAPMWRRVGQLK